MKRSPAIGCLTFGILLVVCGLETGAVPQIDQRPRVRDHRTSGSVQEPPIKLPPLEGPTVQWRMLSAQVLAGDTSRPAATRYRIVVGSMQLTANPQIADRPYLQRFPDPRLRADIVYQRSRADAGLELNAPIAMYLPNQRAYMVFRRRQIKEGQIIVRRPLPPGLVGAPFDIGFAEWDPARKDSGAPPSGISQWQLRIPRDRRTRRIRTERRPIGDQWFFVSEEIALFNTMANAYLVYDAKQQRLGWRAR